MILRNPRSSFVFYCALSAGTMMFLWMAAGELLINDQLFNGFLSSPQTWPIIFLESAVWVLPLTLIMLLILKRLKNIWIIGGTWFVLASILIVSYKLFYFPEKWNFTFLLEMNILFGWILPTFCILLLCTYFSNNLIRAKNP